MEKEIKNVSKTYQRNRLNTSVPASSPKKTALTKRVILRFFPNMEIVIYYIITYMYRNFDENKLLQSRKSVQMNCETLGAFLRHPNFDITHSTDNIKIQILHALFYCIFLIKSYTGNKVYN